MPEEVRVEFTIGCPVLMQYLRCCDGDASSWDPTEDPAINDLLEKAQQERPPTEVVRTRALVALAFCFWEASRDLNLLNFHREKELLRSIGPVKSPEDLRHLYPNIEEVLDTILATRVEKGLEGDRGSAQKTLLLLDRAQATARMARTALRELHEHWNEPEKLAVVGAMLGYICQKRSIPMKHRVGYATTIMERQWPQKKNFQD